MNLIRLWSQVLLIVFIMIFFGVGCQAFGGYEFKGVVLERNKPLPDFELTSNTGDPFHLSEVEGDLVIVYFGYTFCPDVCPMTLARVADVVEDIEADSALAADRISVILISVDPERDTPEVLDRYVTSFNPNFIGLTATSLDEISPVMEEFAAFAKKAELETSSTGYLVEHTARTYLVDVDRQLILQYPFEFPEEDLYDDLEYLLHQMEDGSQSG